MLPVLHCCFLTERSTACTTDTAGRYVVRLYVRETHNSCIHNTAPSSGDLRLVRNGLTSSSYTSGRLEVYYSGWWGTVCNDFWSSTNTRVACRQLGFAGAASPTSYRTSSAAGWDFLLVMHHCISYTALVLYFCYHGRSTLQICQREGWVFFRVFLHFRLPMSCLLWLNALRWSK